MTRKEAIERLVSVTGVVPSEEQLKVLNETGGKLILACAGSGKTTVLTWNLVVDILTGEIDPRYLLCTTYSRAGASEMGVRATNLLQKVGLSTKIEVRTMHSSYLKVLKEFGIVRNIVTPLQRRKFITDALKDEKTRLEDEEFDTLDSLLSYQVNNLMSDEQLAKSYVYTLENFPVEKYAKVREGYNKRKQEARCIDFDDMQLYMYMLCVQQKNPDVLKYCADNWKYFYVDEFQDISKIQFAILRAICTDSSKLLVIGDDDQCIYEWRGADPTIIQGVCGYYDLKRFVLSTNYRCQSEIVDRAAFGIKHNKVRSEKGMAAFKSGGSIKVVPTQSCLKAMADGALEYINHIVMEKGANPRDIAILARNNADLMIVGNMLIKHNYFILTSEKGKLSSSPVFKDFKNIAALVDGTTSADLVEKTVWKLCRFMSRGVAAVIGDVMRQCNCTATQAMNWTLTGEDVSVKLSSVMENRFIAKLSSASSECYRALETLYNILTGDDELGVKVVKVLEMYGDNMSYIYKSQNSSRYLNSACLYFRWLVETEGLQGCRDFLFASEQIEQGDIAVPPGVGAVTLSTIHGAKGLEWKYVIIIADDNVAFPSFEGICNMMQRNVKMEDISSGIDENRRLHYVAMTRAKNELVLLHGRRNLSMFSMEALGLIDIPEVAGNDNIINTAKNGRLESGMADLIESQVYENEAYKPTWVKADGDKQVGGAAVVDGGMSDSEYEDELFGTLE